MELAIVDCGRPSAVKRLRVVCVRTKPRKKQSWHRAKSGAKPRNGEDRTTLQQLFPRRVLKPTTALAFLQDAHQAPPQHLRGRKPRGVGKATRERRTAGSPFTAARYRECLTLEGGLPTKTRAITYRSSRKSKQTGSIVQGGRHVKRCREKSPTRVPQAGIPAFPSQFVAVRRSSSQNVATRRSPPLDRAASRS